MVTDKFGLTAVFYIAAAAALAASLMEIRVAAAMARLLRLAYLQDRDVMMADGDGIEFCRKVKSTHDTNHVGFIMLTAKSSQASVIEGLESSRMPRILLYHISKMSHTYFLQENNGAIVILVIFFSEKSSQKQVVNPIAITS